MKHLFSPAVRGCAAFLSLSVLLAGCSGQQGPVSEAMAASPESDAIQVQVTYAEYGSIDRSNEFAGKIEAAETVKVYAPTQAQVTRTYFSVGETVNQGDVLFELDTEDLELAAETAYLQYQSAVNSADSSLLNAEKSYNSSAQSYQTAKDNLEDLQDEYEDSLDELKSARNDAQTILNEAKQELSNVEASNAGKNPGDEDYTPTEPYENAVAAAQAAYDSAKAAYTSAYSEYERQEETYKTQKSNARDDMEYARDSLELVKGNSSTGTSGSMDYSIQSALLSYESALKDLEEASVTAPISGTIISKSVEESDMASPSTAAYVIQSSDSQVVTFNVSEDAANALSLGDSVTIIYSGEEYPATITELSGQASETTGLYAAKAVPTTSLGTTRTGSAVKVEVSTAKAENTLLLDIDLIEYDENQPYVYVYRDGTAVRTDLETGISSRDSIAILSGLSSDDAVITTWHPDLKDGASVYCSELEAQTASPDENAQDPAGEETEPLPEGESSSAADAPAPGDEEGEAA